MTRPHIIRADSIDLQDHDTPSAKEHKHPATKSALNGHAPHQAETLREIAAETKEDRRISWNEDMSDLQSTDDNHQDALGIAQNGGSHGAADGDIDIDDDADLDDDDDMMDKISSSPSIEDEDIDFEFVYALHTFVATVEGQANATKGDTMVLLDDSNSYWWLVRVVKDSSIGYLPAEHIETPTERLARLNKHRNVDLSSSMLGDTADKTKPTFKTAIRKKKKTVTFTAPQYFEASDIDYSTEEEEEDDEIAPLQTGQQQAQAQQAQQANDDGVDDETAKVEPLKMKTQKPAAQAEDEDEANGVEGRSSDEIINGQADARVRTTKNGTVRNTDSFFRDETVETKKITLTPNLLRDDNEPRDSNSLEVRQRPSFEKELMSDKQKKKEKKKEEKDKKPSAIRSFFSRKDRKKSVDDDDESAGKRSMDDGEEETQATAGAEASQDKAGPNRSPSKLQKQMPRTEPSPTRKNSGPPLDDAQFAQSTPKDVSSVPPATSLRMVESPTLETVEEVPAKEEKSMLTKMKESKPVKLSKAKTRVELDDFDSSDDDAEIVTAPEPTKTAPVPEPATQLVEDSDQDDSHFTENYTMVQPSAPQPQQRQQPQQQQQAAPAKQPPSESPVPVSPIISNPPALVGDTSSQDERSSPVSSPSPELVNGNIRGHQPQDSMTSTSATATPAWNDNNLRAFFDSGSEIRDLLTVVYDKSDVPQVGPDHPIAGSLFREQNAKLAEITTQLDNMLGDWLARKQRLRGTV